MEHVDTCVVWKIDPCPVQSLVARSFVLEQILTNQPNSALKLLSLSMGPSRLIDQRSIRLDLNSPTRSVAGLGQSAVGLVADTLLRWHQTGVEPRSSLLWFPTHLRLRDRQHLVLFCVWLGDSWRVVANVMTGYSGQWPPLIRCLPLIQRTGTSRHYTLM